MNQLINVFTINWLNQKIMSLNSIPDYTENDIHDSSFLNTDILKFNSGMRTVLSNFGWKVKHHYKL